MKKFYEKFKYNLGPTKLDNWIISNYHLLLNETEYINYELRTVVSIVLIQIRELDKYILKYLHVNEWKFIRESFLLRMDLMSGMKGTINCIAVESVLNILKKMREKIRENKTIETADLMQEDMSQHIEQLRMIASSSYHPMLDGNVIDDSIRELNKNTIRELMKKNREFKQKIMSGLS